MKILRLGSDLHVCYDVCVLLPTNHEQLAGQKETSPSPWFEGLTAVSGSTTFQKERDILLQQPMHLGLFLVYNCYHSFDLKRNGVRLVFSLLFFCFREAICFSRG